MLSILGWVFIGFFVGSIGQVFIPGKEPGTMDSTVLIGTVGALIGGLMSGSPFRAGQGDAGFVISLVLAVLGSLVVLAVYRLTLGLNLIAWLNDWAFSIRPAAFDSKLSDSEELSSLSAEEI